MKARVIKCNCSHTANNNPCTYIWVLPEGCELPGKVYVRGHKQLPKGSFIDITLEPDFRSMLTVRVVENDD